MRTLNYIVAFLCVLVLAAEVVSAEIFKWVDNNEVVHYGDAPPLDSGTARSIESIPAVRKPSLETQEPQGQIRSAKPSLPHEETAPAYQEGAVELYATTWCGYCRKAREFFQARGVPFVEYDIEADTEAAQRKREIDTRPGVPLVVINGKPIHGFAPEAYERALGTP